MSSSILYAYLASSAPSRSRIKRLNTPVKSYCPLLPIPHSDLSLRPEFSAVFRHAGINAEDLLTLDDLALPSSPSTSAGLHLDPEQTSWTLVDHNKLEGPLGPIYGSRVTGCIDHHEDEGFVSHEYPGNQPRIIEKAGSCTSLVVRYFLGELKDIEGLPAAIRAGLTPDAAKLALAAILVDTNDLRDQYKTRDVDVDAAKVLVEVIEGDERKGGEAAAFSRTEFFDEISRAKRDIESLPLKGILRKDYKEWSEAGMKLGMSSVIKPLDFLARKCREERETGTEAKGKEELWEDMSRDFMRELELDIWAVMTTFNAADEEGGEFRRQLLMQWTGEMPGKAVEAFVEQNAGELGLEDAPVPGIREAKVDVKEGWGRRTWKQGNLGASRKQVGPMIRKAMSSGSASKV